MFMLMDDEDDGGGWQGMFKAMFDLICSKDDDVRAHRPTLALALPLCALLPGHSVQSISDEWVKPQATYCLTNPDNLVFYGGGDDGGDDGGADEWGSQPIM